MREKFNHLSYVAADEYLSGNVRNKLTVAELAAKNDPELAVNVDALKKVIPKDLSAAEISVRLGATWIPQEDIQRFVMELLTPSSYAAGRLKVRYTPINGDWFIENKSSDMGNVKADSTYGTKRASAYRIIEDTLNLRDTRIFDYVYDEHGNKKAVFNAKETTAAQAKQEVIKQAFQDWIWKDPERRNRLVRYYNDTFNSVRPREYDGSQKLPVPTVNYHNIKTKPSEIQTEMVASLAKRAEKVRARLVEPNIDNMLKITNDGRKLALDQRMIDPMLPDDPDSKVNACVDNVYRIWEEHADTKATQLVFCDLSTPKNDGTFNVYDDMREKLIARGIPAEQVRFIHEATTDAQKKELFGKVRSGEVRVLFGSTPKMGAGTNVQDRLIAIHNLDCPWRPSDVGRILRTFKIKKNVEVTDNGKIII